MFGLSRLFNRTPSRESYAREVQKRMAQMKPDVRLTYESEIYRLVGDDSQIIFLENGYAEYCRAPAGEREKAIDGFLAGFTTPEIPADFTVASKSLLPVLRHLAGLEYANLSATPNEIPNVWKDFPLSPLSGDLVVTVAFDTEHSVQQIGIEVLRKWGRSLDEVLVVALANLRDKAAPAFTEYSPGLYASQYGDYYDAARLLLPELAWQLPVRGTPVAMVPNRTCLLITGDQDKDGMASMISVAEKLLTEDPRPLGPEMFRLTEQRWGVWMPDGENADRLHNLQMRMRASDYATQKQILEHNLKKMGEDVFVATYQVVQQDDVPRFRSVSVLTKGADTLLPKTDTVGLVVLETKKTVFVPWAQFEEALGIPLEPLPYVLPRYRVKTFPSEEALARLGDHNQAAKAE